MSQLKQEDQNLTRREALKALVAATGGIALSLSPQWETPVIEVGALPGHAQTSAPVVVISTLKNEITGINSCTDTSSSQVTTFFYDDPTGNVTAGAVITDFGEYLPSGPSGTGAYLLTDSNVVQTGDGFSGSISIYSCIFFGGYTSVRNTISRWCHGFFATA